VDQNKLYLKPPDQVRRDFYKTFGSEEEFKAKNKADDYLRMMSERKVV